MNKIELRKHNLSLRKTLDNNKASDIIVSKIKEYREFINAENVLIFYPLKYEINLLSLVQQVKKNYYLPRVEGEKLVICPFFGDMVKSVFGILEPQGAPVSVFNIDIAFVPSLAIDKNLNRIGYGKGFYDRLFKNSDFRAKKVAVIQKELIVDSIDIDNFDTPVDDVISDVIW